LDLAEKNAQADFGMWVRKAVRADSSVFGEDKETIRPRRK
jgi:hypothetical protein